MNLSIKVTNIELTDSTKDYIEKRLQPLEKFLKTKTDHSLMYVEVAKTTNHHNKGDIYKAEVNLAVGGKTFYALCEDQDLLPAIDAVKEDMERQLVANKDRSVTLFRRGARSVKKMLKGLSRRNPFTSK